MHRDHDRTLHGYASKRRREPSEAERRMWWILRNRRLGYRFKRQVPMLGYIVDFLCVSERWVIEVDGKQHGEEESRHYDDVRTKALNDAGFRVLRFWAWEIMKDEKAVARTILRAFQGDEPTREIPRSNPLPNPPPEYRRRGRKASSITFA